MQDQNQSTREFSERTDALVRALGVSLRELGPKVGISPAMLFGYRSGTYEVSPKAWRKLREAEKRFYASEQVEEMHAPYQTDIRAIPAPGSQPNPTIGLQTFPIPRPYPGGETRSVFSSPEQAQVFADYLAFIRACRAESKNFAPENEELQFQVFDMMVAVWLTREHPNEPLSSIGPGRSESGSISPADRAKYPGMNAKMIELLKYAAEMAARARGENLGKQKGQQETG